GVTVFLTTQYLEEADALADRVGIIDRGKLVVEGSPTELKATIGRPSVEAIPLNAGDRPRTADVLARFGEDTPASPNGVAVRLPEGFGDLAEVVRALDAEGIAIADLRLHAPTLDDVFLAKTGRSLEGAAGQDGAAPAAGGTRGGGQGGARAGPRREARGGAWRSGRPMSHGALTQIGALARRGLLKTLRQP